MSATAQGECSIKTASLLQQLKEENLTHVSSSMIQEWYQALDPDPLTTAQSLVERLRFLWRILEQWKVSIAVTYNPLMTACVYMYQGHDFGWKHCGGLVHNILWPQQASTSQEVFEDESQAENITLQY
jgi:hypothetical protein